MSDPPIITRAQVAALLGVRPASLHGRIGWMRTQHGFPGAMPGSGGRRYSRQAVLDWIHRAGAPPSPPHNPAMEQDVAACEALLISRARAMLPAE
jgi:hypothetical protein